MKGKAGKKMKAKTQTVRVEVVAPQQQTSIVPAQQQQLTAPTDTVEVALEIARKQMYYRQQLLRLIASQISRSDIYVYVLSQKCRRCGGSVKPSFDSGGGFYCRNCGQIGGEIVEDLGPYLSGPGCRFVLSSAGVKIDEPEMRGERYEGTNGPYIDFECWITVTPKVGSPIRTFGNNPTNDDFFAKRWRYVCQQCGDPTLYQGGKSICSKHGETRSKREAYYLKLEEVDISAVKQKAMTNAWNHAVRDLGLMPTLEHFKDANVDLSKCKRISFGRSSDEGDEVVPAAASKNAPVQRAGDRGKVRGTQSGTSESGTSKNGPVDPGKAPRESSPSTKEPQNEPTKNPPENLVTKAHIPPEDYPLGKGFVDSILENTTRPNKATGKGGGSKFLEISQSGKKLYCFDDKKIEEGTYFGVLKGAKGKYCEFVVNDGKFPCITALIRVGPREWLEDGTPVLRRDPPSEQREPGDEPSLYK